MMNIYTSNLQHLDSDDPSLAEEYQLLLSQFMKHSSSEGPRGWSRDDLKAALHSHTSIYGALDTTTSDNSSADNSREAEYIISGQYTAEQPSQPRRPAAVQQPKTVRFITPLSGALSQRHSRSPSSADSGSSLGGGKHGNPEMAPSLPPSTRKRSISGLFNRSKQTRNSPTTPVEHESSSPATTKARSPAPGIRRSARSKREPKNYYAVLPLFRSDSEEDSFDSKTTDSPINGSKVHTPERLNREADHDDSRFSIPSTTRTSHSVNTLLRNRELGVAVKRQLRAKVTQNFSLFKTWKGASNDVVALAWSPDGTKFAAGATTHCDERHVAYNRPNNLLVGDLTCNRLEEVPGHCLFRASGSHRTPNEGRLFMSVTAMQWFEDTLFTASYDNTVKLWDFSKDGIKCCKTLKHESKVQVMARSNFEENILATGAHSFGLWNIRKSEYSPLEIGSRKDLTPTCLAWGTTRNTKNILLGGMSGKSGDDEVVQNGLLTAWHVGEASITPRQFQPNSQNIFDIKWHPTLPRFATASTVGQSQVSRKTKSVVRIFEPLQWRSSMIEFECPALDINDITFCPFNQHYVTASCTNGITYVWDYRKPGQILLELCHGEPLHQLAMNRSRELQDIGVGMALWGNEFNEFYTGASDGVVKQWDILRSQRDALTLNVFELKEEIVCGAFSSDKSTLLIGDAGGGIHVLSSDPFPSDDDEIAGNERTMEFKHAAQLPCDDPGSESESGVVSAQKLLRTGKLKRHPIFGVGQGPHYDGPFARWARPGKTPQHRLKYTDLNPDVQQVQLDGPPPKDRAKLDEKSRSTLEAHIQMARIRNRRQNEYKRKRAVAFVNLCSDDDEDQESYNPPSGPRKPAAAKQVFKGSFMGISNLHCEVIDLTGDTDADSEDDATASTATSKYNDSFPELMTLLEKLDEDLEEDHWWPASSKVDPNFPKGNA